MYENMAEWGLGTPTKLPTNNYTIPGQLADLSQDMDWAPDCPVDATWHTETQEISPNGSYPVIDCPGDAMDVGNP